MQKRYGYVLDSRGNPVSGATIAVTVFGTTTVATLYSDSGGVTQKANPVATDAEGYYEDEAELQEGADGGLYENYRALRRVAYPSLADQLDAIWKGGADMDAMREIIMGIKEKYKK